MNNNFDIKIVELKYSNGVVGDPYAEDLCHSVNTLINYITGNCSASGGYHLEMKGISNYRSCMMSCRIGGYHLEMKGISNYLYGY